MIKGVNKNMDHTDQEINPNTSVPALILIENK
jgi:hypothetical protein